MSRLPGKARDRTLGLLVRRLYFPRFRIFIVTSGVSVTLHLNLNLLASRHRTHAETHARDLARVGAGIRVLCNVTPVHVHRVKSRRDYHATVRGSIFLPSDAELI